MNRPILCTKMRPTTASANSSAKMWTLTVLRALGRSPFAQQVAIICRGMYITDSVNHGRDWTGEVQTYTRASRDEFEAAGCVSVIIVVKIDGV
jgi:hypothetical protein